GLTPGQTITGLLCLTSDDAAHPTVSIPLSLLVQYQFSGFFGGLMNPPTLNPANAGSTVSFTFSLAGNWGLNVFASGYPKSQQINCTTKAPMGSPTPTDTPPGNPFSYNGATNRYTYP